MVGFKNGKFYGDGVDEDDIPQNMSVVPIVRGNLLRDRAMTPRDIRMWAPHLCDWAPLNYYPYRSLVLGSWASAAEWQTRYPYIVALFNTVIEYTKLNGYFENSSKLKMLQDYNYTSDIAFELTNADGESLYLGTSQGLICVGTELMTACSYGSYYLAGDDIFRTKGDEVILVSTSTAPDPRTIPPLEQLRAMAAAIDDQKADKTVTAPIAAEWVGLTGDEEFDWSNMAY